jgi:hypothetical protein
MRLYIEDLQTNGGASQRPRAFTKLDEGTGDNLFQMYFNSDGKVGFQTIKSATATANRTVSTISINNEYEIWWTYDHAATPKQHIIVNGADQTLQSDTAPFNDSNDTDFDLYIGKNRTENGGYIVGKIIYVKQFQNYIVSPTEASQHYTNKLTIANIAYGKVATVENMVARNL